ncbi:phosphatidylserine decarboxylase proenzyme, mitochondrial-like [Oppia nitens]|uniref:phosphatidylserine decarboxylase proenzyme, mitochondrial-like n=1 Tax=Oppia nitens TaxID=1686743 RepID=UPI0023DB7305|nr:phosphatidylserine decarboxylase proenzyme, mitochondrial-like [Oppia nitens]
MAKLLSVFRVINRSSQKTSTHTWKRFQYNRVKRFVGSLQWFHIPISMVFTYIAFQQFRRYKTKDSQKSIADENVGSKPTYIASISMYKMLPLRTVSRIWGWINSIELPVIMRSPILTSYVKAFGVNLEEAFIDDLRQYKNLGEFFRRPLKPGVRPIDTSNGIVSPSDGTILYFGKATDDTVEEVKGVTYSLPQFLGPQNWSHKHKTNINNNNKDYRKSLLINNKNQDSELYHCVIYLAPGDYHRFHSPIEWQIKYRRHFPGKLLSVRPTVVSWFPNLFNLNERVSYIGKWKYGFFSMTAVGATNVGSVKVYFDDALATNRMLGRMRQHFNDFKLKKAKHLEKGDPFGEFNLGSTIVLVFEAPKHMKFEIQSGQKIKYGQLITRCDEHNHNKSTSK